MLSPNKVQVLGRDFIASINNEKLSDVLGYADGVFVKGYGNSGLKTISVNGTQSEHTLILLDGVKLNNRQNSQVDLGIIQTDEFERIEISKGGSSALYGSEAIGGVINIGTDELRAYDRPKIDLRVSVGSYGLQKYFLKYSQSAGNLSYSLAGIHEQASNDYEYILHQGSGEIVKQRQGADYKNYSFRFEGKMERIGVFAYYNYWNRNLPGIELGYVSSSAKQIDRDGIASASYTGGGFRTNVQYKYSLMNYYDNAVNSYHQLNSIFHSSDYRTENLGAGYEISYTNIVSSDVEYSRSIQVSVYSDAKIEHSGLSIYPSARFDRYSDVNKNIFTGRIGVNYKPFKKMNAALKSSFGNNFRVPTFNELFWKGLGNKDLSPERSVSLDAGVYYHFVLLAQNTIELSYYNINTADRIVWRPDNSGVWHPANIGRVKTEGIELSFRATGSAAKQLKGTLWVNYNYGKAVKKNQDSPNDQTYLKQLIYLPQETFKSSLILEFLPEFKLLKSISLNVFYTFTGKRYMNLENTVFAPYYELVDANISFNLNLLEFKSGLWVKAAVNNLTNTDYQVITGYPMPLRNYKVEVGFKY